jgi:uncharacterized damage-inducible protein DinB
VRNAAPARRASRIGAGDRSVDAAVGGVQEVAMTEVERALDQLRRAWRGPAWHGPAVMEALSGVSPQRASARPIANGHTIWEIAEHVAVWEDVVRRRLLGETVDPTDAEDWPATPEPLAAEWKRTMARLQQHHDALERVVQGLDPAALDAKPAGSSYSRYVLVHGAIQHDLYHAGQIAILAK